MNVGAGDPHPWRVILASSMRMSKALTFFCMNPIDGMVSMGGMHSIQGMAPPPKLTKHINVLANNLVGSLGTGVVLVLDLHGIGWGRKEGNVDVQVIGFLDRANNLYASLELVHVASPCRIDTGPPQSESDMPQAPKSTPKPHFERTCHHLLKKFSLPAGLIMKLCSMVMARPCLTV